MNDTTIRDVAREAGVSIATVSRVMNDPEQVNIVTRARVIETIDRLKFVPRNEARGRARRDEGRIGVLAPFFTYPSFVQRLRGVAAALAETGYELVIYNVDTTIRRDRYLSTLPLLRRLDGLIVMALEIDDAVAERLQHHELPMVLIESNPAAFNRTHAQFTRIDIDDVEGGRIAGEYLIARGYQRIGFVGDEEVPDYALHTSDQRLNGLRHALAAAGRVLDEGLVRLSPHGLEQAEADCHRLLDLAEPPDAIFSPSDTQAMGVLRAARARGLRVPEDLAIIGFDDVDIAEYIGLTTIRQSLDESGRVAVDQVLARIADPTRPVQHVRLQLQLVRRMTA